MRLIARLIMAVIDVIRPILGPQGCCIHPISCRQFAHDQLNAHPFYKAMPRITLRVLTCNPITIAYRMIARKFNK